MGKILFRTLKKYLATLAIVIMASGVQWLLWPYIESAPFVLFYPAVILASLYGDGLTAIFLSALVAQYFFVPPIDSFELAWPGDWIRLGLFLFSSFMMKHLIKALQKALSRSEEEKTISIEEKNRSRFAVQQLQLSEARTRSVLENAIDAVVGMDAQGFITHWNPQAEKIFGYSREEAIGRKMSETIVPLQHREAHDQGMKHYLASGKGPVLNRRIEITALRRDGVEFPIELSITPLKIDEVVFFAAFVRDISEQRRMKRDLLLKSEALEKSLNGFDIVNAKGEFIYANHAYLKMWGYDSLDEVKTTSPSAHCDDPKMPERIVRILKDQGECDVEFIAKRKDGSTFEVRMWARLAHDAEGNEVYPTTSVDITDRKRTEELVKQSEESFRTLANAMPQLCWMANPDGHIFWYNRGWYNYTGTTFEEMQGWGWEKVHHPDLLPKMLPGWKRSLESGEPWEDVFQLKSKDGEFRWFLSRANPVRDGSGKVIRWFGSNTDITSERQFAEKLEITQAELRLALKESHRASEAKSEFLANMSHEIRTPMNSILGFSEMLLQENLAKEERIDFLKKIRSNGDQLLRLIDDILDLSKVESGKIPIDKVKFSIGESIQEVMENFAPIVDKKKIQLKIEFANLVPQVIWSDPVRTKQILTNLVGNAIKFTDAGIIYIRLEFLAKKNQPNEGCLEIEIEDSGIGISTADQKKIFTPFGQADSSIARKFGGTGLGLVLSRRLAIALGGTVNLKSSTPGKGSCFRFSMETGRRK